jgi:DNA-binding NtrC family response regulator
LSNRATVWVIDSEHWPRACLCAELLEHGFDVQGFEELAQAMGAFFQKGTKSPVVMILELKNQPLTGTLLDTLQHTGVPVLALTGVYGFPDQATAAFPWAQRLQRPVTIGQICDSVEQVLTGLNREPLE